jgi:hypothetical protein
MRSLEECNKYQPDIKRVTKSNSFTSGGRIIYIVKKDYTGKTVKVYVAYDKETKIQLMAHWDKEFLIEYIRKQDLTIFGGQGSLF